MLRLELACIQSTFPALTRLIYTEIELFMLVELGETVPCVLEPIVSRVLVTFGWVRTLTINEGA
jgi:hypothetical protein